MFNKKIKKKIKQRNWSKQISAHVFIGKKSFLTSILSDRTQGRCSAEGKIFQKEITILMKNLMYNL